MPKIGVKIEKIKEQHVELIIWYTRELGFFYKGLPSDFINVSGFRNVGYESENTLLGSFRDALDIYHERMKQTKKVIKYTLGGTTGMIMAKVGEGRYSGTKDGVSNKFSSIGNCGYGFSFDYDVLIETSGTDKKRYYRITEDGSVGYEINCTWSTALLIDWTPEREQFFKDMVANLQRLINGVSSFFDQPDMTQLMDTRGFKAIE